MASKPRSKGHGPADLQPFRHDGEYLRYRIRYRIRYRMLYIVYDIVRIHDVVYDIPYMTSYTTSYAISYTTSYAMYPSLPPLRFNQPVLPLLLHAGASGFQLPCVLNPEHASFSSLQHPLLKSFWGTPSRSSTSRY